MPQAARSSILIALGGLLALAAAMGIGRFVYTPILPFMTEAMSLGHGDAGLIASANFLGYLVGALGASLGKLPGSHRLWFLGALLLSAVTTAAMGTTVLISAFVVLRFVGGAASAFVLVFSSALILERLSDMGRHGLAAFYFAGVGCGIAFSAVLIDALADAGMGWRTQWIASGLVTLICLLLAAFFVPSDSKAPSKHEAAVDRPARMAPGLVQLIIAYGLFGFGYVITATFISVITHNNPELRPVEPYVWLLVGLSAVPSIYVWNRIGAAVGGLRAFALACLLEAIGVVLSVVADSPALEVVAALLLGGTFMGITAMGLIEARKLSPHATRRVLAIMTASFGLGQVIGPWFAGIMREHTGSYEIASFAAAGALVVAAALVGISARPVNPPRTDLS